MTVNHGVLGSSPCSGADARGLRGGSFGWKPEKVRGLERRPQPESRPGSPKPFLRELSSAGSERLPYKQRVGGSNPSAPTNWETTCRNTSRFFCILRLMWSASDSATRQSDDVKRGGNLVIGLYLFCVPFISGLHAGMTITSSVPNYG